MSKALKSALEAGGWQLALPLVMSVESKSLALSETLRLLPGKRATLAGLWGKSPVVAKLFLPAARSEQEAEISGFNALKNAAIPTPELLWSGQLDSGLSAVIYERLEPVESLSAGLRGEKRNAFLAATFELLASMHRSGISQSDIHFDNFLLAGGKLHVIDNASLKVENGPLSAEQSLANMAAFIAQFSWRERRALLSSPYLALPLDLKANKALKVLDDSSRKIWWLRAKKYLKKVFRNCTEIAVSRGGGWFVAHKRELDSGWVERFRASPDGLMVRSELLKDGNSATVARCAWGSRSVVVKRYNIKSTGHRLRRMFRPTRAANAWRAAHLLKMAGIKTPEPLLLMEQRRGPLRGVSYLVTEDAGGAEMLDVYQKREPTSAELDDVRDIFRVMRELRLCHGDFKARNFLVTEKGVELIDLDVFHEVGSHSRFYACAKKDKERFLRNWYAQPAMEARFKALLADLETEA